MNRRDQLVAAWIHAGSALGFRVNAPYLCINKEGTIADFVAFLPDFGGPSGMLVSAFVDSAGTVGMGLNQQAEAMGFYYSCINADVYAEFDAEVYKEALADWGYFGDPNSRPAWLNETKS